MQLHDIQPKTTKASKKRVGRGGKRGKTSGRGHKGQKARSGSTPRPALRDIIKKIPKLRGYKFNSIKPDNQVVNLSDIEAAFSDGDEVTPHVLLEKGLVRREGGVSPKVKILGEGDISKKVTIAHCKLSKSAREKVTAAGGSIEE